ncbi:unnamed protein product [Caenorhabditis sp. 36 PRJEB53466]|nr:unnamed protein product [Caenorhabditis sp. 36 PRJEB53466]
MAAITSTSNCSPVAGSPLMMLLFKAMQEGGDSEDEARRRREQLNRRPSYRMILKDLETADKVMKKEPEETPPSSVDASPLQSVMRPPPTQIASSAGPGGGVPPQPPRIPVVTSSSAVSPYGSPLGTSLLANQQLVLPFPPINGDFDFSAAIAAASQPKPGGPQNGLGVGGVVGGGVPGPSSGLTGMSAQPPSTTQPAQPPQGPSQSIEGTSGLVGHAMKPVPGMDAVSFSDFGTTDWQSPMLSGGYSSSPSPTMQGGSMRMGGGPMHGGEDESNRKRQVRLLKNREAAKECRRKKKEYVKCLENRVSVLENQNKALIEELKTLKELYCRKEKDGM